MGERVQTAPHTYRACYKQARCKQPAQHVGPQQGM